MDWQKFLDSPLATWIPILVLVIFVSLLFRKQIAELIERVRVGSIKVPDFEGSFKTSQVKKENKVASPPPSQEISLRPKIYRRFIGRQAEFDKVMVALRDPKRKIILLTGLGGIGKTALAREVLEQVHSEGLFEYLVWSSAKTEYFVGEQAQKMSTDDFTFGSLVEDIARQVGQENILRMKPQERQTAIQALLASQSVLIVVDNLDTIPDNEGLVNRLYTILGKGKALCTSRHGLKNEEIYTIGLKGIEYRDGARFFARRGRFTECRSCSYSF